LKKINFERNSQKNLNSLIFNCDVKIVNLFCRRDIVEDKIEDNEA